MARRRLGRVQASAVAASPSFDDALALIVRSPYGRLVADAGNLADAERGIAATLLWHVRVLAGWLPAEGAEMMRSLAAWFEIANIDEHMYAYEGSPLPAPAPFRLGGLATAWPRLAAAGTVTELRAVLAGSVWGDPGEDTPRAVSLWLRLSWAERVSRAIGPARPWAAGAAALLVARERFAAGQVMPGSTTDAAARLIGSEWPTATSLAEFTAGLPSVSRWALAGIVDPTDLWRGEARWWARLHRDGLALLTGPGFGSRRPLGAVAILAADAWRTCAALEVAGRAGAGREVLDEAA